MFKNRVKLLILIGGLVVVLTMALVISLSGKKKDVTPLGSPVPKASALPTVFRSTLPTPLVSPNVYNLPALQKDFERITNANKNLSLEDTEVKKKLVARLNNKSGVLVNNDSFNIEYIKSADEFLSEVRILDTEKAKIEATKWLLDQGLSEKGVCFLPIVFYLRSDIATQLKQQGKQFNPIPKGCFDE